MKLSHWLVILCLSVCLLPAQALAQIQAQAKAQSDGGTPVFVALAPALVVNVADGNRARHMQVTIQLRLSNAGLGSHIDRHTPALRHELVMLLSDQPVATLKSAQGKIDLGQQALAALQKVMTNTIGVPAIEAVYFTEMIIQ